MFLGIHLRLRQLSHDARRGCRARRLEPCSFVGVPVCVEPRLVVVGAGCFSRADGNFTVNPHPSKACRRGERFRDAIQVLNPAAAVAHGCLGASETAAIVASRAACPEAAELGAIRASGGRGQRAVLEPPTDAWECPLGNEGRRDRCRQGHDGRPKQSCRHDRGSPPSFRALLLRSCGEVVVFGVKSDPERTTDGAVVVLFNAPSAPWFAHSHPIPAHWRQPHARPGSPSRSGARQLGDGCSLHGKRGRVQCVGAGEGGGCG